MGYIGRIGLRRNLFSIGHDSIRYVDFKMQKEHLNGDDTISIKFTYLHWRRNNVLEI